MKILIYKNKYGNYHVFSESEPDFDRLHKEHGGIILMETSARCNDSDNGSDKRCKKEKSGKYPSVQVQPTPIISFFIFI